MARQLFTLKQKRRRNPIKFFKAEEYQQAFWLSKKKDKVILGGNRSGKTENGAAYVIKRCLEKPNQRWWACTVADLSVAVQQRKIYRLIPKDSSVKYARWSEVRGFSNRVVIFANGSVIRFKTYDQGRESFQGEDRDGIWNDEEAPEDVFKEQRMRLIDRSGEMIRTMTPLNGYTYTYNDVVTSGNISVESWYWDSLQNPYINKQAFIDTIKNYNPREAEARRRGTFANLRSGRIYYSYESSLNKSKELFGIDPDYPIRLSFDFNVNPMTTLICQIVPGNPKLRQQEKLIKIIRCISTPDSVTLDQCNIIKGLLAGCKNQIIIYGDASNPRRTEASATNVTNWYWVKKVFPKATYKVPTVNDVIVERTAWVNSKLYNLDNEIGILLNSKHCDVIETDLEQVSWDGKHLKKDSKNKLLNHASDTLDYLIAREFKLKPFSEAITSKQKLVPENLNKRLTDVIMQYEEDE